MFVVFGFDWLVVVLLMYSDFHFFLGFCGFFPSVSSVVLVLLIFLREKERLWNWVGMDIQRR